MGQILHGSARTTEAIRRAIQNSQESLRVLAACYGIPRTATASRRCFADISLTAFAGKTRLSIGLLNPIIHVSQTCQKYKVDLILKPSSVKELEDSIRKYAMT